jgi:phage major tail protein 2
MAVIKGGDLMLFLESGTGSTATKKSIAFATNHTLNISADTKETSSKDSGGVWQTSEVGILSWTASSENLYADAGAGFGYDELFDMMLARKAIKVVFGIEGDSANLNEGKLAQVPTAGWKPKANKGYEGSVIITGLSKNAPNGDNATFTVDFTGVGELKKLG